MPITEERRAFIEREWREVSAENIDVRSAHILAGDLIEDTLYAYEVNAQAEATRRQALFGVLRHRYEARLPLTAETEILQLGDVVTLQVPRYGLSAGKLFRVIGVEPDVQAQTLTVQLWGPP